LAPSDEAVKVAEQVDAWLHAGVRVVLVVDPQNRTMREYRAPACVPVDNEGTIDLGDVVPKFRLDVAELFE